MATFHLESLGGSWPNAQPAVVARPGRIDVFLVGENGELYHYWLKTGQSFRLESLGPAPSLGGRFRLGALSAVSWDINRRDVFAFTTDSRLLHYWQDVGEAYFDHETLGDAPSAGRPTAVSWAAPRWDVFHVGGNGNLHQYSYPIQGPAGPFVRHLEYDPEDYDERVEVAAVAQYAGRIDVFAVTKNHRLIHHRLEGEDFIKEPTLNDGGHPPRHMDAVSWAPGRLDLFTTSNDFGVVWLDHYWQTAGFPFGREQVKSFHGEDLPVTVTTWRAPRLDAFTIDIGDNRDARHYWQENSTFQQESLGGDWRGNLAAVSWGPRRLDLFTIGLNKQLYHYWQG